MSTMDVIKYLVEEMEENYKYNEEYRRVNEELRDRYLNVKVRAGSYDYNAYRRALESAGYSKSPNNALVKQNAKKIRQLLRKLY